MAALMDALRHYSINIKRIFVEKKTRESGNAISGAIMSNTHPLVTE